jgi:hypothetical protein
MMLWNRNLLFYILEDVWNTCMYCPQTVLLEIYFKLLEKLRNVLGHIHSVYNPMHGNSVKY